MLSALSCAPVIDARRIGQPDVSAVATNVRTSDTALQIFNLAIASNSVGIVFADGPRQRLPSPTLLRQLLRAKQSSPEEAGDM